MSSAEQRAPSRPALHVVHLGKYYPPAPGGIERHVQTLARAQAALGARVEILCVNHLDAQGRDVVGEAAARTFTEITWDGDIRVIRVGTVALRPSLRRLPGALRGAAAAVAASAGCPPSPRTQPHHDARHGGAAGAGKPRRHPPQRRGEPVAPAPRAAALRAPRLPSCATADRHHPGLRRRLLGAGALRLQAGHRAPGERALAVPGAVGARPWRRSVGCARSCRDRCG